MPAAKLGEKSVVRVQASSSSSNQPAPVVESDGETSKDKAGPETVLQHQRLRGGRAGMVLVVGTAGYGGERAGIRLEHRLWNGPLAQANDAIPGRYRLTIQGLGTPGLIGCATRGHAPRSRRARGVGRISRDKRPASSSAQLSALHATAAVAVVVAVEVQRGQRCAVVAPAAQHSPVPAEAADGLVCTAA